MAETNCFRRKFICILILKKLQNIKYRTNIFKNRVDYNIAIIIIIYHMEFPVCIGILKK